MDQHAPGPILIFDDETSLPVELDFRGTVEDFQARLEPALPLPRPDVAPDAERRGPGRPKLGVIAREVTLLPRHWEWLNGQPGGASVALRKLVEAARKSHAGQDRRRQAAEAVHRFLHAVAGDLPEFEEANRAFYAGHHERMTEHMAAWPAGVRDHVLRLVARTVPSGEAV
jgi:hypothetical protein